MSEPKPHQQITHSTGSNSAIVLLVSCAILFNLATTAFAMDRSWSVPVASAAAGCGTVSGAYPDGTDGSGEQITRVSGISCGSARHIMLDCITHLHVGGWHASYDSRLRMYLRDGKRLIVSVGIAGGGPLCFAHVSVPS